MICLRLVNSRRRSDRTGCTALRDVLRLHVCWRGWRGRGWSCAVRYLTLAEALLLDLVECRLLGDLPLGPAGSGSSSSSGSRNRAAATHATLSMPVSPLSQRARRNVELTTSQYCAMHTPLVCCMLGLGQHSTTMHDVWDTQHRTGHLSGLGTHFGGPSRSSVSALRGSLAMRTGPSLRGGGAEPGGGVARKGLKGLTAPVGPTEGNAGHDSRDGAVGSTAEASGGFVW